MKTMKRFNNKILIITLLVLLTGFVLAKVFRSPSLESNLDEELFKIDTSKVTEIRILPDRSERKEIKLIRDQKNWKVQQENASAKVEQYTLNNLLGIIAKLKPERMVSRKKEKWDTYSVGDTTGIPLIVLADNKEISNLRIGKESSGTTYVRENSEDEVYAIEGNLREIVNRKFNSWRDRSFLRVNKDLVTKVTFKYPADSGFVIEKRGKTWMIGNEKADSAKIENYISKLRSKDLSSFIDNFSILAEPELMITIESNTSSLAVVKAWRRSSSAWVLSSDLQPDVYFLDEGAALGYELFPGKEKFLP